MVACMSRISMQAQMLYITPAREVNALPGRGRDRSTAPLTKIMFHDLRDKKLDC